MEPQVAIGGLLREWRQRRRLSQLELALGADISTRHLSFIETGRAQPSREMVLNLAERLEIPLRERNRLLVPLTRRVGRQRLPWTHLQLRVRRRHIRGAAVHFLSYTNRTSASVKWLSANLPRTDLQKEEVRLHDTQIRDAAVRAGVRACC